MADVRSAIVLGTLPGADASVGGLPLAVRAVLALRQAGFDQVGCLAPGRPARLARPLEARGVPVAWTATPDEATIFAARAGGGVLLLPGDQLVDAEALASLRSVVPGLAVDAAGRVIGAVLPPDQVQAGIERIERLRAGSPGGPDDAAAAIRLQRGLAVPLATAGSRRALERQLLDVLARRTQSGDSYLAALIDRRLSRPLTRLFLRTPLSPSHVTLLSVGVGLLGAAGLATVSPRLRVAAVVLLVLSIVLDCVDGEVARARYQQSAAGARLDVVGDYVVHLAVFAGLATGLLRQGVGSGGGWAALALVPGVGAAMLAMHVLFIRPALQKGGDLHWHPEDGVALRGTRLGAVAEKVASRDYTYLLLVLALVGHLEWFLYAAAAGSWAFAASLVVYRLLAEPTRRGEAASS